MSETGKNDTIETPRSFHAIARRHAALGQRDRPRATDDARHMRWARRTRATPSAAALFDPAKWIDNPATKLWAEQSSKMWDQGVAFWTSLATLNPMAPAVSEAAAKDRRFTDPDWTANPVFAMIRQTYGLLAEQMLATTRQLDGPDPAARAKMEFAAKAMADAMAPTNLALTNPEVIRRAVETRGESLLKGLKHMLDRPVARAAQPTSIPTRSRSGSISRPRPGKVSPRDRSLSS